jgi:hypothetical protein
MPDVLPQNSIASLISDLTAGSLNREIVWIFKRASQPFLCLEDIKLIEIQRLKLGR